MQEHSVLLTNCDLSSKTKRWLLRARGRDFAIRSVDSVRASELSRVEIMLLDIIQDSGKQWLGKTGQMPKLRFIQSTRAGVDSVDFQNIPKNVIFCGNVGAYSESMSEFAIGMILYLAKDLGNRNAKLKAGIADQRDSIFLQEKTMGVVGAGGIGQGVARIAKCLGMTTLGVNTNGKPARYCDRTFSMKSLNRVLATSDVVVLALPLTIQTFYIIGKRELESMKKNCILVNLGRGYVINERDLFYHLKKNQSFKCGLDVWWHYPKKNGKFSQRFPFQDLPNFLGTPHVSGFVPEQGKMSVEHAVQNIVSFAKKRKLRGLVNRKDYEGLGQLIRAVKTS